MTPPDHVGPLSETNVTAPEMSLSGDEARNLAATLGMMSDSGTTAYKLSTFLKAMVRQAERDPKSRSFGTLRVTIPVGREASRF